MEFMKPTESGDQRNMLASSPSALLVQHKSGLIFLAHGGHLYGCAEPVPFDILGDESHP
jgi:hypothetical protein